MQRKKLKKDILKKKKKKRFISEALSASIIFVVKEMAIRNDKDYFRHPTANFGGRFCICIEAARGENRNVRFRPGKSRIEHAIVSRARLGMHVAFVS